MPTADMKIERIELGDLMEHEDHATCFAGFAVGYDWWDEDKQEWIVGTNNRDRTIYWDSVGGGIHLPEYEPLGVYRHYEHCRSPRPVYVDPGWRCVFRIVNNKLVIRDIEEYSSQVIEIEMGGPITDLVIGINHFACITNSSQLRVYQYRDGDLRNEPLTDTPMVFSVNLELKYEPGDAGEVYTLLGLDDSSIYNEDNTTTYNSRIYMMMRGRLFIADYRAGTLERSIVINELLTESDTNRVPTFGAHTSTRIVYTGRYGGPNWLVHVSISSTHDNPYNWIMKIYDMDNLKLIHELDLNPDRLQPDVKRIKNSWGKTVPVLRYLKPDVFPSIGLSHSKSGGSFSTTAIFTTCGDYFSGGDNWSGRKRIHLIELAPHRLAGVESKDGVKIYSGFLEHSMENDHDIPDHWGTKFGGLLRDSPSWEFGTSDFVTMIEATVHKGMFAPYTSSKIFALHPEEFKDGHVRFFSNAWSEGEDMFHVEDFYPSPFEVLFFSQSARAEKQISGRHAKVEKPRKPTRLLKIPDTWKFD
jgi:hypothetical protein